MGKIGVDRILFFSLYGELSGSQSSPHTKAEITKFTQNNTGMYIEENPLKILNRTTIWG